MILTDRQHRELVSLAGFPPVALDDEAAVELEAMGLVETVYQPNRRTCRYRFTDTGRAALPVEQHARLARTEATEAGLEAEFARRGIR